MEQLMTILACGLLAIWILISLSFFVTSIQTFIDNRARELRERESAKRDEEYHAKRMESFK